MISAGLAASLLFAAPTLHADAPRSLEVRLPAPAAQADNRADMRGGIAWLTARGAIVDRCGIDVDDRTLIVDVNDQATVDAVMAAGFAVVRDLSMPAAGPRGGLDPQYLDPAGVEAFLNQVAADHPSITRVFSIGTTTDGRDILAIEISDHPGVDEDEPAILLDGLHHAREVVTPHIITDAIDTLTDGYAANDPQIVAWVENYKSILVPMVNPDGSARVHSGDLFHRKNVRPVCTGGNLGVDLNRNYPYKWGSGTCDAGPGSSGSVCSDSYRGPSAASEPETQAMIGLAEAMHFAIAVSYHSYGQFIDYPYACNPGNPDERMPEHDVIDAMMHGMADAIQSVDNTFYYVNSPVALGPVNGDDTSWYYAYEGTYPFIVETGTSFQPSFAASTDIVARNRAGWQYLYSRLGQARIDVHVTASCAPVEAEVTLLDYTYDTGELPRDTYLPFGRWTYLVPPNDSYTIRVTKAGYQTQDVNVAVGNSPVTVSIQLDPEAGAMPLAGDMNGDCVVDGRDIPLFTQAVLAGSGATADQRSRGDFNADCEVSQLDVGPFLASLLATSACP